MLQLDKMSSSVPRAKPPSCIASPVRSCCACLESVLVDPHHTHAHAHTHAHTHTMDKDTRSMSCIWMRHVAPVHVSCRTCACDLLHM